MSDELKSCPFCGGVPAFVSIDGGWWFVKQCCPAHPFGGHSWKHLVDAIAAWNQRATPVDAVTLGRLEALKVRDALVDATSTTDRRSVKKACDEAYSIVTDALAARAKLGEASGQ